MWDPGGRWSRIEFQIRCREWRVECGVCAVRVDEVELWKLS